MTKKRSDDEQQWGVSNDEPVPLDSEGKAVVKRKNDEEPPAAGSRIRTWLRLILIVAIIVVIYNNVLRPLFEGGFGYATTLEAPGDPTHFDPVASLGAVQNFAG